MSLTSQFVATLVSAAVSFSGVYADINVSPEKDKLYNFAQRNTEQSSSLAQGANMNAGIVTIDRAKGNKMTTNDTPAHTQYQLQTLAKLPIIMYAVRVDSKVAKGEDPDAISMIEGFSAEATTKMWDKHGGISILQDLSKRYNLQETTAKADWFDSTMSAVDVGRLIRRFMDDKDITSHEKKWVLKLLKSAPMNVSGEDMSWGIPSATGADKESSESQSVWAQGWSPSGKDPMVRHSVGMVDQGYRFIVVVMGQVPESTSNDDANRVATQTLEELISGGSENGSSGSGVTLGGQDSKDDIENFLEDNEKYM